MSTESEARELANKIEGLNIKSTDAEVKAVHDAVTEELNAMPLNHRANVAHEMDRILKEDHAANNALPNVDIAYSTDSGHTQHVEDVNVKLHGEHTGWFGMNENKTVDVYDNPGRSSTLGKILGPNIISQSLDTWDTTMKTMGKEDDAPPSKL